MNRFGSRAFVLSVALASALFAAAGRPVSARADSISELTSRIGLRGTLEYKNFSHFEDAADDGNFRNEGILTLDWRRRLTSNTRLSIVTTVRGDDENLANGLYFSVPDTKTHRSWIDLSEVVLRIQLGNVRIGLGKQIEAWGTADSFNPTDNVNPWDYLDPIDGFRMGVWSARASTSFYNVNFDFTVIPPFTPSRLPSDEGRWATIVEPPIPGLRVSVETDIPGTDIDSMQYAVRAKTTLAGWDIALSYYDGIQDTPDLDVNSINPATFTGTIRLFHPRIRVPGLAFSTTWEQFEFHGEGVAIFGERKGREDRFQGIVGINYTWDATQLDWLDQLFLILEYAREEEFTSRGGSPFIDFGALSQAFRDAISGRLRLKFTEDTEFAVFSTVDLTDSANYFAQPELTHKFTDDLHLETGFDFISGADDTFWGRWNDNDRFYMFLKYYF